MDKDKYKRLLLNKLFCSLEEMLITSKEQNNLPIYDDILIIQFNGIGDNIMSTGFIRELYLNNSTKNIWLLTNDNGYAIYENCPYLYKIIKFNLISKNLIEFSKLVVEQIYYTFWNFKFDKIFIPQWGGPNLAASVCANLIGAHEVIGYGINQHMIYGLQPITDIDIDKLCLTKQIFHPLDMYNDTYRKFYILESIGYNISSYELELWLSEDDHYRIPSNSIILGIGGSLKCKKYPINLLINACIEINKLNQHTFIIIGSNNEVQDSLLLEKVFKENNISYINLVNKLTIRQVISTISQSQLYIGNDTFTLHVAAVFNKPIIGLYMEAKDKTLLPGYLSSIQRFAPYNYSNIQILQPEHALDNCQNINIHGGCASNEAHCITSITPQHIIEAYKKAII